MVMVGGTNKFFIVLSNALLPIFICVFWIMTEAITEGDVARRKLATQDRPGFISIDCGVDEAYLNNETGIYYKSDKDFIYTGENRKVLPQFVGIFRMEYDTLRSFPEGKRNCYALKPEQGKNNYYLIRASFLYGNYDGNGQVPEFDLYIGVNYWTTVKLSSESVWVYYEMVYFFSADTDYVCLVKTGSGIPFLSALELRLSDDSLFNTTSFGALMHVAYDLGIPNNRSYRYDDDVYDRIWLWPLYQIDPPGSVAINTSLNIDTRGTNGLPVEVLRTAIKPPNGSNSMTFSFISRSLTDPYLCLFHFAEIEGFAQNHLREFTISLKSFKSQPIRLEYLKPFSLSSNWTTLGLGEDVTVTLNATADSVLPPIVNAIEIFQVLRLSLSPTDQSDVDAIMAIKHIYNINKDDWQGDPCLPKDYTWSGIGCKFNGAPRIISLNMSASKLTGEISSAFSDLQAIEWLDLSNNELSGQVPEVLAQLPNLKFLNLSGNKFTGSVPQSLKDKSDNGSLVLSMARNHEGKKFAVPVITSFVASVLVLIALSILLVFCMIGRRRKGETLTGSREEGSFKSRNRIFTYSQIVRITGKFTTIVGKGGFGKVYLGKLNDDTPVAVKVLSSSSKQGYKEFRSEAQLLMIVHHRNLVSLIGYCDERGNMALIYEYMANGNLRQRLSETTKNVLNWKERLQIATDAAQGLEYLHNGCKPPIIHRDMKSTNILLTEDKQAKISDFGLSRIFITETASHISTRPAGTFGYLDPEYQVSGNLTKKSDVYSFGIILLELITGQPAVIRNHDESIHILEWLNPIVEKGDIRSIVDPRLQGEFDVNAAWKMIEIAMSCAQRASARRPDMSFVLTELKECMAIEMAFGRTQRMQNNMTASENSVDMSVGTLDSDMVPTPR